jgi:RNA 3'-terminal phosphate cyclase-like protein
VTNGSRIEVSETGTSLTFVPGLLVGGRVEQECSPDRCVGYYLEPLLALGPFCKAALWNRNRRNRNFLTSGTGTVTC